MLSYMIVWFPKVTPHGTAKMAFVILQAFTASVFSSFKTNTGITGTLFFLCFSVVNYISGGSVSVDKPISHTWEGSNNPYLALQKLILCLTTAGLHPEDRWCLTENCRCQFFL